ncbi:hypothetical protein RZS08_61805, partial [Arthrospira platensis SPKY1]|nr:hypothetical protein [Arthrospira platensis SPKY1]
HVGRAKGGVADQQHRQTVFMQGDVARTPGGDGHAAGADVGVAFAAAGFRAQPGNGAQHLGRAGGTATDDVFAVQRAHRHRLLHGGTGRGRAGDHHTVEFE